MEIRYEEVKEAIQEIEQKFYNDMFNNRNILE